MRHNFLVVTVKKGLKSVYIYRSYYKNNLGGPLFGTPCTYTLRFLVTDTKHYNYIPVIGFIGRQVDIVEHGHDKREMITLFNTENQAFGRRTDTETQVTSDMNVDGCEARPQVLLQPGSRSHDHECLNVELKDGEFVGLMSQRNSRERGHHEPVMLLLLLAAVVMPVVQ